uniref:Uncharacterized protein n=1 Tax=viral metagenome TaxID=1070528 RepID=A0A6M3KNA3_9ZZZZ
MQFLCDTKDLAMPRDSITATLWRTTYNVPGAWGTNGTQSMVPVPHIEGLGSWAGKMDDRMCFLAFQQADTIFSDYAHDAYHPGDNEYARIYQCRLYYNGVHPQMVVGFSHAWSGYVGNPPKGTYSVRLGDVDFGTVKVSGPGGTTVYWYANLPDSFAAGEYTFQIYGAAEFSYTQVSVYGIWAAFLPVRL